MKKLLLVPLLALATFTVVGCADPNPAPKVDSRAVAQANGEPRYTVKYTTTDGNVRTVNTDECWYSDGWVSFKDQETGHTTIILTGNSRAEITRRW